MGEGTPHGRGDPHWERGPPWEPKRGVGRSWARVLQERTVHFGGHGGGTEGWQGWDGGVGGQRPPPQSPSSAQSCHQCCVVMPSLLLVFCLCPALPALQFPTTSISLPVSHQNLTGSHWHGARSGAVPRGHPWDGTGDAAPGPSAGMLGHRGRMRPPEWGGLSLQPPRQPS